MLKWAVNGSYRQAGVPAVAEDHNDTSAVNIKRSRTNILAQDNASHRGRVTADASSTRRRSLPVQGAKGARKVRRKSSDIGAMKLRLHLMQNKENHMTSTPSHVRNASPLRKLGSLKDVSNLTPESNSRLTPKRIETPAEQQRYATTLPSFDVEYSPCGLVPGAVIALRGVGIADNYFEKPRYVTHRSKGGHGRDGEASKAVHLPPPTEEESLSSSKMGDVTLERMIDAILESARKDRKIPKSKQITHRNVMMSPTYTPADDPASDLHEFWDSTSGRYKQEESRPNPPCASCANFNEREVRTPESLTKPMCQFSVPNTMTSCQLRRQKAVRRKRKFTEFKTSVRHSAQKLLKRRSLGDLLDNCKKIEGPKRIRNDSPDSGRNSSSDMEEFMLQANNFSKRRLSFSVVNLENT